MANTTDGGDQIRLFFLSHSGEHSAKVVAQTVGISANTAGQYLLGMTKSGELERRMNGLARGRHYVYKLAEQDMSRCGT